MDVDRYDINNYGGCDMCTIDLKEKGQYVSIQDYHVADQNRIDLLKEVDNLQYQITKLKAENERLKCCGNCEGIYDQKRCRQCKRANKFLKDHGYGGEEDNWQPLPSELINK